MKPPFTAWKLLLLIGAMPVAGGVQADEPAFVKGEPSFRRHVIPLLGRAGCSSRECHGSFSGQGGFQLSLFGYDFDADHKELTQDTDGGEGEARVNPADAANSLLVTKPTAQVKHKGKERFNPDHAIEAESRAGELVRARD